MQAIALSDVHLGWDQSEATAFRAFLADLPDVDYLLVLGDFYEMWRRDLVGVVLENRDVLDTLARIQRSGTTVQLIAGNHDLHFSKLGPKYALPFQWSKEFRLQAGSTTYVFKHGHQFDPTCQDEELDEALCHTTDEEGQRLSDIYDRHQIAPRVVRAGFWSNQAKYARIPLRNPDIYRHIAHPGLRGDDVTLQIVRQRARASIQPGEFLVHGHTHVPLLEANYADTGCWVEGRRDYLAISGEGVELRHY